MIGCQAFRVGDQLLFWLQPRLSTIKRLSQPLSPFHDVEAIFWSGDVASSETSHSSTSWPAKQERPTGDWPGGPPPTIKSIKCLYREERKGERERERRSPRDNRSCSNNFFCTPFNIFACYMSILPPSSTRPNEDALKASCDQGSCSGTNHFRGPKSHLEVKSGPPWIGEEYSLTHDNLLHTIWISNLVRKTKKKKKEAIL